MSYDTITKKFTGEYVVGMKCWCSIQFAVPQSLFEYYERSNEDRPGSVSMFCPLGHSMIPAGESAAQREAKRLRDELAHEKHRSEQARADADYQRTQYTLSERRVAAKKGQLTKLKNRIGNGVCPCCNRYFANLHRHMAGQHPDWSPETVGDDRPEPVTPEPLKPIRSTGGTRKDWNQLANRRRALGISAATAAAAIGVKGNSLSVYESMGGSLSAALRYVAYLDGQLAKTNATENASTENGNPL